MFREYQTKGVWSVGSNNITKICKENVIDICSSYDDTYLNVVLAWHASPLQKDRKGAVKLDKLKQALPEIINKMWQTWQAFDITIDPLF